MARALKAVIAYTLITLVSVLLVMIANLVIAPAVISAPMQFGAWEVAVLLAYLVMHGIALGLGLPVLRLVTPHRRQTVAVAVSTLLLVAAIILFRQVEGIHIFTGFAFNMWAVALFLPRLVDRLPPLRT